MGSRDLSVTCPLWAPFFLTYQKGEKEREGRSSNNPLALAFYDLKKCNTIQIRQYREGEGRGCDSSLVTTAAFTDLRVTGKRHFILTEQLLGTSV